MSRVVFAGSKALGLRVLRELSAAPGVELAAIVTIDDSGEPGDRSRLVAFRAFARETGVRLEVAPDRAAAESMILERSPEICVVCGWYWIISAATLERVPGGVLAIHHSELPRFRGNAPVVWAMIKGEKQVGVSLFRMTPGLDDGPLWAQARVAVDDTDYIGDVLRKLEDKTVELFGSAIAQIVSGARKPSPQEGSPSYCAKRTQADGLIDWTLPAERLYDFVRAQSRPYPGAFSWLGRSQLIVWRARPYPWPCHGAPGQLMRVGDEILVACGGDGSLALDEVQLEGAAGAAGEVLASRHGRLERSPAA